MPSQLQPSGLASWNAASRIFLVSVVKLLLLIPVDRLDVRLTTQSALFARMSLTDILVHVSPNKACDSRRLQRKKLQILRGQDALS